MQNEYEVFKVMHLVESMNKECELLEYNLDLAREYRDDPNGFTGKTAQIKRMALDKLPPREEPSAGQIIKRYQKIDDDKMDPEEDAIVRRQKARQLLAMANASE